MFRRLVKILFAFCVLGVLAGLVYAGFADIPPPNKPVVKEVSDAKLLGSIRN